MVSFVLAKWLKLGCLRDAFIIRRLIKSGQVFFEGVFGKVCDFVDGRGGGDPFPPTS